MPNWVRNGLTITGAKERLEAFAVLAEGRSTDSAEPSLLDFEKLVPTLGSFPDAPALVDAAGDDGSASDWVADLVDERERVWGTKWGACWVRRAWLENPVRLQYRFSTAWGPPLRVIEACARRFPSLIFELAWYELGLIFAGHMTCAGTERALDNGVRDDPWQLLGILHATSLYDELREALEEEDAWWRENSQPVLGKGDAG